MHDKHTPPTWRGEWAASSMMAHSSTAEFQPGALLALHAGPDAIVDFLGSRCWGGCLNSRAGIILGLRRPGTYNDLVVSACLSFATRS